MVNSFFTFACKTTVAISVLIVRNFLVNSASLEIQSNTSETNYLVVKEYKTKKIEETVYVTAEHSALNKPASVTWKLNGQYVEVSWKRSNPVKVIEGYYISMCSLHHNYCNPPDFVHFNKEVTKGRILGVAPDSTYIMKVRTFVSIILFNDSHYNFV